MIGSLVGGCASAPIGHTVAAPPKSVMNSRRLIAASPDRSLEIHT
jgi:hypothetical protein